MVQQQQQQEGSKGGGAGNAAATAAAAAAAAAANGFRGHLLGVADAAVLVRGLPRSALQSFW